MAQASASQTEPINTLHVELGTVAQMVQTQRGAGEQTKYTPKPRFGGACEVAPEGSRWEILLVAEVTLHHCTHVLVAFGDSQRRAGNVFFLFYDPFLFIPFLEKPQPLSPSSL